jgi:Zn-dependent M28 family amino/carboxypeptidase
VAALEVASWLRAHPPAHSVIIALFDGEEAGLRGARAFTDAPPVPLAAIALNINLDMVGRNDAGELFAAGLHHYPQLRTIVDSARTQGGMILRTGHDSGGGMADWTGASDHAAFHAHGIPFLYFGVEDHADYHRESDDAERIQAGFLVSATRTIIVAVRAADGWLARGR